jgi:hypothetical protein
MESIVSEVKGSYTRPEKSCGGGRVRTRRLGWHILRTRLEDNEGARGKECRIVGIREVERGPTLKT